MSLEATLAEVMGRYREKLRQLLRQDSRATTPPATISDRLVEIKPTKNRDVAESTKASPSNLTERHAQVGEIPPSRFVSMSHEELKSAERREEDAKLMKENLKMAQVPMAEKSISDALKCGKCGQKKVSYSQAQTRSADEPMTTFCECTVCGNRWKVCDQINTHDQTLITIKVFLKQLN